MTDQSEKSAFRRPGFLLAGLFLALIVVLAVVAVVSNRGGISPPESQPSPSTAPPAAGDSGCHPTDTSQTIPTAAPTDVTWSLFRGVAVPSSATAGPLQVSGDVARCYAHTPLGAVIAAIQIDNRIGADGWRDVVAQQVASGPARDAFINLRSRVTPPPTAGSAQIAGFKFLSYAPQTAVMEIGFRFPQDGTLNKAVFTVTWDQDDWKLQALPDGTLVSGQEEITSLDGFVPFSGV